MAKNEPQKPKRELRTKPSIRHPEGLPRCKRQDIRDGKWWQCPRAARDGFEVCGKHGAGHPSRERAGIRKNPKTAAVVHGQSAKPGTVQSLVSQNPEFEALFRKHLTSPALLDFRPQIAIGKALVDHFLAIAELSDTNNSGGRVPPALAVVDRLEKVVATGERCLKIEASLGAITHDDLRYYFACVAETIARFVPAKRQDDATAFLTVRLRNRDAGVIEIDSSDEGDAG